MGCNRFPRLITPRLPGLSGAFFQPTGGAACIKGMGNYFGVGRPGSSPKAYLAVVEDATTLQVAFTRCVDIVATTGIQYQINGTGWVTVSAYNKVSDTVWEFTVGTLTGTDDIEWQYVGGNDSIVDCDEAADVGDQYLVVYNTLDIGGFAFLLETGGSDFILLESSILGSENEAIATEDRPA